MPAAPSLVDRGRKRGSVWLTAMQLVEYAAVYVTYHTLRFVPQRPLAAAFGGLLAALGPHLRISRGARANIAAAYPEMPTAEREAVLRGAYRTFGRIFADYFHLGEFYDPESGRVEIVGGEHLDALRDDGRGGILFGAHLAHWDMILVAARRHGLDTALVYRALNNRFLDVAIGKFEADFGVALIPKGHRGTLTLSRRLRDGGHVVIVADQRYTQGVEVPFFGRPAPTAPAIAALALTHDVPLLPVQVERLADGRYRVTAHPPIELAPTGDRDADIARLLGAVNAQIEVWVRARPDQWLWMHNRWG